MFKKKPLIKTLSPLRSSDRRKTADRIIEDYKIQLSPPPEPAQGAEPTKDAPTTALTALRKSLLPESCLTAKFTTTSGPDLAEVNGTVYVGGHSPSEQRVLWIEIDKRLYPSVYTLWKNPRIVPLLHTPKAVVSKLKGGADLMTPGLAGPPFPTNATKGAIVAVASIEKPSVPAVVGTCLVDVSSLKQTQGVKGQAVQTFHWEGDELWNWSTSGRSGAGAPDGIPEWTNQAGHLAERMNSLDVDDEDEEEADGGVALSKADQVTHNNPPQRNTFVAGEDIPVENVDENYAEEGMSTKEIDSAFRQAFIYGVYQQLQTHRNDPKKGLVFPLSQSFVMSTLVQPYLPAFTPGQTRSLQIKQTSWKSARKFIIYLHKEQLLLSKEGKNEAAVLDIDFDDRVFKEFQPYRLPKKDSEEASGAPSKGEDTANGGESSIDDSVGQTLRVLTLYKPSNSLTPLFSSSRSGTSAYHTSSTIRTALTNYITSNSLLLASNKRMVSLSNPFIANTLLSPDSNRNDAELLAKGSMPRDVLAQRLLENPKLCAPYHAISREDHGIISGLAEDATEGGKEDNGGPDDQKFQIKPRPGAPPKITIMYETRSGNKTATRVHGLEPFRIHARFLADELRKSCASSTSVEPFRAGGKGAMEVMVQGPQQDAVNKALAKRGVDVGNNGWVDFVNKTKGKGKK
ncbi:MAG: hypothetical protein M1831_007200 [Alyxoria varia]|nr:MAG: hypothetical protein M1831_007200 [Alyxoria varia]